MQPRFVFQGNTSAAPSQSAIRDAAAPQPHAALSRRPVRWRHRPEYVMEAAELGVFMIAACLVVALLDHPSSPVTSLVSDPTARRALTGIGMGLTAIGIVYSPWGKQSGAHFNPSVTLTFWRLGKVTTPDAVAYAAAHFVGAVVGVLTAAALLGESIAHPAVNYVATLPLPGASLAAFVAELSISFGLMMVVLIASNTRRLERYTGLFCGVLVATYISVEAPISGMSMNPARSFAPALVGHLWNGLWIYFTAPPLGMLMAAEVYVRVRGRNPVACAKLHHRNNKRCIFCLHRRGQ